MGQAIASITLADLLAKQANHSAAREILDVGVVLCQTLGHRWGMATCLRHLGDIAKLEGRVEDAKAAYLKGLGILQDIGQRQTAASCLIELGQVCTELGQHAEARQHLRQALIIAAELQDETQMVDAALALALLLTAENEKEKALEIAILAGHHPGVTPAAQEQASRIAAELGQQMPAETSRLVERRARTGTPEGILAESYLL